MAKLVEIIPSASAGRMIYAVAGTGFLPALRFDKMDTRSLTQLASTPSADQAYARHMFVCGVIRLYVIRLYSSRALYELGRRHEGTHLVPRDLPAARQMYRRASKLGCAAASYAFANWLLHGIGGPQDIARAIKVMERAYQQNGDDGDLQLSALIAGDLAMLRQAPPKDLAEELRRVRMAHARVTAREDQLQEQQQSHQLARWIAEMRRAVAESGRGFDASAILRLLSACLANPVEDATMLFPQLAALVVDPADWNTLLPLHSIEFASAAQTLPPLSLLQMAAISNRAGWLTVLLDRGAAIDFRVLPSAAASSSSVTRPDVMAPHNASMSALFFACAFGRLDCVRVLLQRGASVKVTDSERLTPLHAALCYQERPEKVRRAKKAGLDKSLETRSPSLLGVA